jgi:hypothetical protein
MLMENEKLITPNGINFEITDEGMGKSYFASGDQKDLEKLAIELINTSPKICIAVPFAG